jgi:hypothetical protein
MPEAVRVHLDPGDLCVYRGTVWHMGNYVPYVKRATIIDLVDTPAYAEFRTRAGLDKELADRTTTRSVKDESGSPDLGGGNRNAGEASEGGAPPFAQPVSPNRVVGQPSSAAVTLPEPVHLLIAETIAQETSGAWKLTGASREADWVRLRIQSGQEDLDVEFGPTHGAHVEAFLVLDGVAFKYLKSSDSMSQPDLRRLDAVARKLRKVVRPTAAPR